MPNSSIPLHSLLRPLLLFGKMGKVVERIPNEIWLYISTFLPRDTVRKLHAVNRSFFAIAVAAEYRVLTFSKHDKFTKLLLQHLRYVIHDERNVFTA